MEAKSDAHQDGTRTPSSLVESQGEKEHQVWTRRIVEHIQQLLVQSKRKAEAHSRAGHYFREHEVRLAVPLHLIPAISAPLVTFLAYYAKCGDPPTHNPGLVLGTLSLVATGVLNALSSFFRYGVRSHSHHSMSSQYDDLCTDISSELSRSAKFRTNVERFLTDKQKEYDQLCKIEPVLPPKIVKKVESKIPCKELDIEIDVNDNKESEQD